MDNLLCDESWLSDPKSLNITQEDDTRAGMVEEAIAVDLEKESRFSIHGDKFIAFLFTKNLTDDRLQAVQWMIQSRDRLNLSYETIFSAASCFDRFIYVTNCYEWTKWMVELVAVTCVSIASKFIEVETPTLQDIQLEGIHHIFHHKTILEMELILMRALEWRVNSVTTYSFVQHLVCLVDDHMVMNQVTEYLLSCLCDLKMLKYPPSVVAVSALWYVYEAMFWPLQPSEAVHEHVGKIVNYLGQDHKDDMLRCVHVMKSQHVNHWALRREAFEVTSFLRMLQIADWMKLSYVYTAKDLSAIFQIIRSQGSNKKRGREQYQQQSPPAKKMAIVTSN